MILILDCGSSKTRYIRDLVDNFIDVEVQPILDFQNNEPDKYKGVILSGAPILVTEQDVSNFLEAISWIKETHIPVLGICFGHQIIGMLFGAQAYRMREDRDWQIIESFEYSPLLEKIPVEFEMMEDHCETISIPPGFDLIASSDACVNEVMQHKERKIYGVQFHPEVSGNHGAVIIENFINICLGNEDL